MVSFSTKTLCILLLLISHAHAAQWELLLSNEEAAQFTEESAIDLTGIFISPHNPDLIYVLSDVKLYKTENAGQSWLDASKDITEEIITLTMNPQQPNILYLATYDEVARQGQLFKSTDAGITWVRNLNYLDSFIRDIAINPHNTNLMYLANITPPHLFQSQDAGETWQAIDSAGETFDRAIERIILNPHQPQILYAVHKDTFGISGIPTSLPGLYKSTDGGLNWVQQTRSIIIPPPGTQPVAINPHQPNILYIAARQVTKSLDAGNSWDVVTKGIWAETIAINPQNPDIIYMGARPGLYRSDNAGQSWQKFTPPDTEDIYVNHIAIDPHHPEQVYITTTLKGLYRLTVDSECTARYDATTQQVAIPCLKLDDTPAEWSAVLQQKEAAPQFEVLNVMPK